MKRCRGSRDGLPFAGRRIHAQLDFDFFSTHYAEVAVAILLKMIFRVFSFSCNVMMEWMAKMESKGQVK